MNKQIKAKDFKKEFGVAVRKNRHKHNLSQEVFAESADIHRTYVSSIELGKVDVGIGVAYKLAASLNMPLSKLIRETELAITSSKQ